MINRNLSEVCDRRVNRRRARGRWASGATGQRRCQPTTMSSRVPAGEQQQGASQRGAVGCQPVGRISTKVPAYGAVRCQRTEPGGGQRKDRERASHNRLKGHRKGFWDDSETERDRDVTNRSFRHQRYKPSRTEALLRPRVRMPYRRS